VLTALSLFLLPEQRQSSEHRALGGNSARKYDIECRDAIGRYDQQLIIYGVDVAHLAPAK